MIVRINFLLFFASFSIHCISQNIYTARKKPCSNYSVTADSVILGCENHPLSTVSTTVNGGTPPYMYLWSNGESTEDIEKLPNGSYTVTVTDSRNCQVIDSSYVQMPVCSVSAYIDDANCEMYVTWHDEGCLILNDFLEVIDPNDGAGKFATEGIPPNSNFPFTVIIDLTGYPTWTTDFGVFLASPYETCDCTIIIETYTGFTDCVPYPDDINGPIHTEDPFFTTTCHQ